MERPSLDLNSPTRAAIEDFLSLGQPRAGHGPLDVDPIVHARGGVTPWQFLSILAERREIAFHGTGDPNIESFEPREPIDFAPFGHQKAVFATTDPIWAMYYAIVDRDRYRLTLNNGCILLMDAEGRPGVPSLLLLDHGRRAPRSNRGERATSTSCPRRPSSPSRRQRTRVAPPASLNSRARSP